MNHDPLDTLSSFYEECRMAQVPASLVGPSISAPWWVRLAIPFGGLSFGGLVALLLISMPSPGSRQAGAHEALALSLSHFQVVTRQSQGADLGSDREHSQGSLGSTQVQTILRLQGRAEEGVVFCVVVKGASNVRRTCSRRMVRTCAPGVRFERFNASTLGPLSLAPLPPSPITNQMGEGERRAV